MPLMLADEEYARVKEIISTLLGKLPQDDESVKLLGKALPELYDRLDQRQRDVPKIPVGEQPAFPVWSIKLQNWMPGMTYRQWLIGMSLQGQRADMAAAHSRTVAQSALADADAIIAKLDNETLDQKVEKEKSDGAPA